MENERTENTRKPAVRTKTPNLLANELGKVPPQAVDIEQAVLGAMMLEKNAVTDVIDMLTPSSFYDPKHQFIYGAIRELFGSSSPIDLLTVSNKLRQNGELEGAGGAAYISQLTSRVASSAHVEFHARIIAEKHIKRELIRMSGEVIRDAYDDTSDVFDVLNKAEGDLFNIAENNMGKNADSMQNVVRQAIEEIERASQNTDGISGVPTGFFDLDKVTAGWQRSDMIVIAARPAMGKTAFVLSMARNTAVDHGMGVALFSLEMSSVQLVKRLIASEARIDASKLRKGDLREDEFQQLHSRITKLATAPIYIDDTPGISIFDLRAKCRRLKMQHDIQIVIIDYLQLMTAGGAKGSGNREQEISSISRSIKEIAKELNVPVVALSQLSRPEYYGFMQDEDGNSNEGVGEIMIAKHRNGDLKNVRLRFIGKYARFDNIDNYSEEVLPVNSIASSMNTNTSFDNQGNSGTITLQSKMNSFDKLDTDFDHSDGKVPF
jgi:replicative DNA helicase